MKLAPIVLFVYNRPWHTQQTVEALQKNILASDSDLFIYSDGFKSDLDKPKVLEVRKYIKNIKGFKSLTIKESPVNKGLADSIIDGVTEVINKYGKIIVIEDDIVTSTFFLQYMNDALDIYKDEEKVMHISGYWFPVKKTDELPDTFFYNTASCWGWGTWKRAWEKIELNPMKLKERILKRTRGKYYFDIEDSYPFFKQLEDNAKGIISTWAIKWYAAIFLNNGLALHPNKSFTNNIGHDGTGVHCKKNYKFIWKTLSENINIQPIPLCESKLAREKIKTYFLKKEKTTHITNIFMIFSKLLPNRLKEFIKDNILLYKYRFLKKVPRYKQIKISLLNHEITIPDSASFLFLYKEIFIFNIYNFKSDKDSPYIIDVGANIGLSIIYFKTIYPNSKVIGFEPDPKIFDILTKNISAFNYENITLINKAVWDSSTVLKFCLEGADGGRIVSNDEADKIVEVETVSLRSFIEKNEVDLLKIDIEGSETVVLEDIADVLKNVNRLFVEYHSFAGREQTLEKILLVIKEAGFRYYINHPGLTSPNQSPFMSISTYNGIDMGLNIYAFRD